jgi:hypothetical protein
MSTVPRGIKPETILEGQYPDVFLLDSWYFQVGNHLVVQMQCTGYNLFMDTKKPDGLTQTIRKSLGIAYRNRLLRVVYLDKYGIELEHPDLEGMPEILEEIGTYLYEMAV